jgi:hypothetical protein
MSTELAVYDSNKFSVLQKGSDLNLAMLENGEGEGFVESDFPRVKTPSGGGVFWTVNAGNGMESKPFLEGVIVFKCRKGILWKSDETSEDKPVLVTDDMKYARLNIPWAEVPEEMQPVLEKHEVPQEALVAAGVNHSDADGNPVRYFYWDGPKKLPYCEFGSATKANSKGKRAKEYQVLYLLRDNEALPLRIQLGPTSITPMRKFFIQLNVPHYMAYVKLGLKTEKSAGGKDYSVVVPERIGTLDKDSAAVFKEKYKDVLQSLHESGKLNLIETSEE